MRPSTALENRRDAIPDRCRGIVENEAVLV